MKHTKITAGRRLVSVLTALLLILAMTASALPQEAWADTNEFEVNGLKYKVTADDADVKTVEVTGPSNMSITDAVIPDKVTNKGTNYTVTSIADNAFEDCTSLQSFTIPNSVTSIKDYVFNGCTNLTEFEIAGSNATFSVQGDVLFCDEGKTLFLYPPGKQGPYTVPDGVTTIGPRAFVDCSNLKSVAIPDGVTSIGQSAFNGCSSLKSVAIPDSVTSIGNAAFINCSDLTSITGMGKVETIGQSAFNGCTNLTSVAIPDSVTSIEGNAFNGCSGLKSVTIPDSVTSIGNGAFSGCSGLTSVTIPISVTSIGISAFKNCTSLTSVTIPISVTTIMTDAFSGCTNLQSVTIPNNLTMMQWNVFSGCSGLTSILVMFDSDPEGKTINNQITNSVGISGNSITWYRGWRSFAGSTADIIDITVTPGSSYDLYTSLHITDTIYEGESGPGSNIGAGITIPAFTLSGNTSTDTELSDDGQKLTLGADETGILLLKTYGKTIRVNGYQPPAVSYWCTLTADALSFTEMETRDTPQPQPLQLHCSGNTGASITKVALSGTDFLLDDSKAETYVRPGNTNSTYLITPKADLAPGTYKATVTVTYSYGQTTEADVTLTVTEAKQEAPAKLTAKSKNYRTIALSWTAASRAEKYQVYRATKKNGTYKRISTTSKTSLNNIKLTTGKTYYYKVRAYRTAGGKKVYSPFTKIISATPKPSAPSFSLKAGKGRITVSWKSVSGASGYRLYRASSKNGKFILVKDSRGKVRSYTHAGLRSKKTYYYKLRAYRIVSGKKIYSSYTEVKTIKTR